MRILMLNTEKGWRGGERQTLLSLMHYQAQGHQVSLLARRGHELAQRAQRAGIHVHTITGPIQALAYLILQGRRYDIVHAQTAACMTWLALLSPLLGARTVFTRRTAFPITGHGTVSSKRLSYKEKSTRWKWSRATALVAISQAAAAEPQRLGLPIDIIPSAVDYHAANPQHIQHLRAHYGLDRYAHVLGTSAAHTVEKDPATLIRAVHALYRQRQDFIFLHFGASGSETATMQAMIQQFGLQDCYLLCGFEEHIEDAYRLLDVFVLSSRHEALGSSVLDAFIYQVPVVATTTGGLPELLGQDRGLACAVGDHTAMANAMAHLLTNPQLTQQLRQQAYQWVTRTHSVPAMAQQYLRLYQRVLNRSSGTL